MNPLWNMVLPATLAATQEKQKRAYEQAAAKSEEVWKLLLEVDPETPEDFEAALHTRIAEAAGRKHAHMLRNKIPA